MCGGPGHWPRPSTTMSSFRRWMGLATSSPQPFCRGCPDASRIIHCTKQALPNLLPQVPSSGDMAEELAARDWTSQPGYRIASLLTSTGCMNFSFKGFVLLLGWCLKTSSHLSLFFYGKAESWQVRDVSFGEFTRGPLTCWTTGCLEEGVMDMQVTLYIKQYPKWEDAESVYCFLLGGGNSNIVHVHPYFGK